MAVDPCDPRVIYAGGTGLFKSTDCGATWDTLLMGTGPSGLKDIETDPKRPGIVYATPDSAVKSIDGGKTWCTMNLGIPLAERRAWMLEVDPTTPTTLYVGIGGLFGGPLLKSTDGGETWTRVEFPLEPEEGVPSGLLIDASDPQTVYVEDSGRVIRSRDGGESWQFFEEGLPEQGEAFRIAQNPKTGALYLAFRTAEGTRIYRRTSGESWTRIDSQAAPVGQSELELVVPDRSLYLGGENSLYRMKLPPVE